MPSTSSAEPGVLTRFAFGSGELHVLATIQGLVSEAARVRDAFARAAPTSVALGVSPESASTLLRYERKADEDPFEDIPDHDFIYSLKLGEFGAVDLPPPDILQAARLGKAAGVNVYGVDLTEEAYEEAFTKQVSAFGFLRYGRIQRRLAKKPPRATDAASFSLAWDAAIRKVGGIARVEALREAHIARASSDLAAGGERVFLVVDLPRAAGVLRHLSEASAGGLGIR